MRFGHVTIEEWKILVTMLALVPSNINIVTTISQNRSASTDCYYGNISVHVRNWRGCYRQLHCRLLPGVGKTRMSFIIFMYRNHGIEFIQVQCSPGKYAAHIYFTTRFLQNHV